jgi:hypothetical protein
MHPLGLELTGSLSFRSSTGRIAAPRQHRPKRVMNSRRLMGSPYGRREQLITSVSPLIPTRRTSWVHGSFDAMCQDRNNFTLDRSSCDVR